MSREPLSLDAPRGGDAETTLGSLLPDRWSTKPDEHASARELAKELDALLEGLTPRERQVLRLRFGLDGHDERTLEEIGRSFDLTRERVRQIVAAALGKLQRETRLRHLDL
jgi:RNA polymerase primary sigma factor